MWNRIVVCLSHLTQIPNVCSCNVSGLRGILEQRSMHPCPCTHHVSRTACHRRRWLFSFTHAQRLIVTPLYFPPRPPTSLFCSQCGGACAQAPCVQGEARGAAGAAAGRGVHGGGTRRGARGGGRGAHGLAAQVLLGAAAAGGGHEERRTARPEPPPQEEEEMIEGEGGAKGVGGMTRGTELMQRSLRRGVGGRSGMASDQRMVVGASTRDWELLLLMRLVNVALQHWWRHMIYVLAWFDLCCAAMVKLDGCRRLWPFASSERIVPVAMRHQALF